MLLVMTKELVLKTGIHTLAKTRELVFGNVTCVMMTTRGPVFTSVMDVLMTSTELVLTGVIYFRMTTRELVFGSEGTRTRTYRNKLARNGLTGNSTITSLYTAAIRALTMTRGSLLASPRQTPVKAGLVGALPWTSR